MTYELSLSSHSTTLCREITIINDKMLEDNETFTVQLSSNNPNVNVTLPQSTVTIIDDDSMCHLVNEKELPTFVVGIQLLLLMYM